MGGGSIICADRLGACKSIRIKWGGRTHQFFREGLCLTSPKDRIGSQEINYPEAIWRAEQAWGEAARGILARRNYKSKA